MKRWICSAVLAISLFLNPLEGLGGEIFTENGWVRETESPALSAPSAVRPGDAASGDFLKLYAQSAVLIDGRTGRVLYGKGQDMIRPMASTTKIMTCILALELGNPDDRVTASSYAASQPKVHLGVRSGEQYRLEDLLYALMLESYNDAAVMIAEHIGGSAEEFASLMNQKARSLGCENTYFITPNGLDGVKTDENGIERIHSTTASELAQIMRYCVTQSPMREAFLKITQTQNYYFTDLSGKRSFSCCNHNAMLTMMKGILSGKTGFTGGAGYSYVGAMENEGRTYIISLLGCGWPPHKTYKWSDARKLYNYGLENFQMRDVFQEEALGTVPVTGGLCWEEDGCKTDKTSLSLNLEPEEMHLALLLKEDEQIEILRRIPNRLEAPVRAGQQVGSIDYILDGQLIKSYPVYAKDDVEAMTLLRSVRRIVKLFLENGKKCHKF